MSQPDEKQDGKGPKEKKFTIIVNAREYVVHDDEISFEQVINLPYPNDPPSATVIYTVNYKRGHGNKEGSMSAGDVVKVKDGMIFNVTQTNKS